MKTNELVGNIMMIGVQGKSLSTDEKKFLTENNIGGVTLFGRNIESLEQICSLIQEIQDTRLSTANKAPLIIAIDMEGGRVARLKEPFTIWPPIRKLGDLDSAALTFKYAECMGRELNAVGINLDFAPCVDVLTNLQNVLIGDRSLGEDPEIVGKHGSALVRGYINSRIITCAKHFPGHGNTVIDSHEALPEEDLTWDQLSNREIQAFKKTFRARVDMVMTAHIKFNNIDPEWPVTLSEKFLQDLIKETGFRKIVITDDLDMKALTNHYDKKIIPVQALKAGAHVLLYCNEPESHKIGLEAVVKAVESGEIPLEVIKKNYDKMIQLKAERIEHVGPLPKDEIAKIVGCAEHKFIAESVREMRVPEDLST
ncbi:MAG: beta-N-acetylhexosaminidase [Bdellovibrionales bacterium]|nr:beta-N-acetylhexosaminidase [Bdellovibrionales bacterium]